MSGRQTGKNIEWGMNSGSLGGIQWRDFRNKTKIEFCNFIMIFPTHQHQPSGDHLEPNK